MNKCLESVINPRDLSDRTVKQFYHIVRGGNYSDLSSIIWNTSLRRSRCFASVLYYSHYGIFLAVLTDGHGRYTVIPSVTFVNVTLGCRCRTSSDGYDGFHFPQGRWRPVYVPCIDSSSDRVASSGYHSHLIDDMIPGFCDYAYVSRARFFVSVSAASNGRFCR
jgi:hypothetical protein